MELLEIKAQDARSLNVRFLPEGSLDIEGVSCDEDPKPIYQKLANWIEKYKENPAARTILSVKLKYFNTSSARCLLELFSQLVPLAQSGKELRITWYYENGDEDMQDAIKTFEDLIKHKIEPVPVASY